LVTKIGIGIIEEERAFFDKSWSCPKGSGGVAPGEDELRVDLAMATVFHGYHAPPHVALRFSASSRSSLSQIALVWAALVL
jgi:hypothetical protein